MKIYEDNLTGLNNIETYEREEDENEIEEEALPVIEKMDDTEEE
jgi:hypothetical protein